MKLDKKLLSIEYDDDDKDALALSEFLEDNTNRVKEKIGKEFTEKGDQYLKEIERKKLIKSLKAEKLIKSIIKHTHGRYSADELRSYSYEDVQDIYNEVIKENPVKKFFHFLFNM